VGIGERAQATPDAIALVSLRSTLTYAELDDRQARVAGALRGAGMRKGDRIAVYSANRQELLECSIGALRTGVVPVPIHRGLTTFEAAYILEDSGARWLFCDVPIEGPPSVQRTVTFGDAYERLLHETKPARLMDHVLGRPMHYTSGTTGKSKGVWVEPMSHSKATNASLRFRRLWDLRSDDIHLVCSPLSHSAPHRYAMRTLEAGGTVVLQTKFEPEETLAAVELFSATTTFVVPTHLERIIRLGKKPLKRYDLSTMRLLIHAGAPIRPETKKAVIELFPPDSVWEFYGSTEGQATRISAGEWLERPGSVGQATEGGKVFVRSDEDRDLRPGETGQVWIENPANERFEYWGDREKTRQAWNGDAFSVGDLGYVDDDGYLFLTGRANDMIISGGVNVYPQEVEDVLASHPSVAEVVVYGAAHPEWGEQVQAAVVPAYGQPIDPDALKRWARERLAGFKCPRRIDVVDELPRTPTGKVQRRR
jgi:long-chain acyl-CoA synthetase